MPRKVQGCVTDLAGNEIAILKGDWNDNLYYEISKSKNHKERLDEGEFCLWKKNGSPAEPTRYKFSSFGVTLNEIMADLEGKIAPTDSRLRPDQRHLENGEYEKATVEKHRLEEKQRMERDMDQGGVSRPRWFEWNGETFQYTGRYWEAKQHRDWSTCPDLLASIASSSITSP
ncbi:hypothetical protein LUZ60_011226 [Juncus effusus]|nr:hypothetical protein LUZ60_011226 [Juncus effusus]